jgi:GntR family transcriptional repressor for pyruvate dehydrogenase complex
LEKISLLVNQYKKGEESIVIRNDKKMAYAAIIERIREMIRRGELAPGDRLPPERSLAEAFGVSRGSLRQAFQALAERHILESRQGHGTYLLTDLDTTVAGDAILDVMSDQQAILHDVIEFRHIIEPEIAALAVQRATPAAIDRLKVLVCDQQRALLAGQEDDPFDAAFHQQLVTMTGNSVLQQVMQAIQTIVDKSRANWLQSRERRQMSIEGHLRIIDALEKNEINGARQAMQEHIATIERHIFNK